MTKAFANFILLYQLIKWQLHHISIIIIIIIITTATTIIIIIIIIIIMQCGSLFNELSY